MAAVFVAGNLLFLLYAMQMMSAGIQKSAGEKMQKALSLMTKNRFLGVLTGLLTTMVIQSSGATSVMVISFVNAKLLTLTQAASVIFGANIGTTATAWLVSLFGFNFHIESIAVPIVGAGFLLTSIKRLRSLSGAGEAIIGFGLLFMGLAMMSGTFTSSEMASLTALLQQSQGSLYLCALLGLLLTALIHSSSALTAIVITMAFNRLLTWPSACAMVIGSELGSTIDAILAALPSGADAKRLCFIHVFINACASIAALVFFKPLLLLVDALVAGTPQSNMAVHIAMMHTLFKVIMVAVALPFTGALVRLAQKAVPNKKEALEAGEGAPYRLMVLDKENAASVIIRAEKEIQGMADLAARMFDRIQTALAKRDSFALPQIAQLESEEDFADQMHYELCRFLLHAEHLSVTEKQLAGLSIMMQVVDELELMTDDCLSIGLLLKRSVEKKMKFPQEDMDALIPYVELARQFLQFIHININRALGEEKLSFARELEGQIDLMRKMLKKRARKRLESGADVKAMLLYIDIVRQVEKIGDRAFSISALLAQSASG